MPLLDLSTLQAFILVAELRSFTYAADVLGSTQSAISLKLKRLEAQLGRTLLERTPRSVRLSVEGQNFLPLAKDMLAANERAFAESAEPPRKLVLGMSDHVAGPEFPALLTLLAAHDPNLLLEVKIGTSRDMLLRFDEGELDAAIVRKEGRRKDGESLFEDKFGWFAAISQGHKMHGTLRLISLTDDCGMRAIAVKSLQAARIDWVDAFIGGGIAATAAAAVAGLGVAVLAQRMAPAGTREVGIALGLPPLPSSHVMLHTRVADHRTKSALRLLAAAFRAPLQNEGTKSH
jgi:DNA-binding transcriptional LysR family regulator